METEAEKPAAETGEWRSQEGGLNRGRVYYSRGDDFFFLCAEVKPDAAVDDWEAIATDEEKGETTASADLLINDQMTGVVHICDGILTQHIKTGPERSLMTMTCEQRILKV